MFALIMLPQNATQTTPQATISPDYAEGQLWQYLTRPGEEDSCVLINQIEEDPLLGRIFHISVLNVQISNPLAPEGVSTELPHFPVAEETLQRSLTQLLGVRETHPDYLDGYEVWREAFDEGKAGIFSVDVAEIVNIVEQSINQQH